VNTAVAILYDAPSDKSTKQWLIRKSTPLEKVVVLSKWTKVRDAEGTLAWIENANLGARRTLQVRAQECALRTRPSPQAPALFQLAQNVVVELLASPRDGWVRVRHPDGEGYLSISEVFGL